MSGSVKGYIVTDEDRRIITDDFGAVTMHTDWLTAASQAHARGGSNIVPVLVAARPTTDSPRRGRRPKQQEES